MSPAGETKSLFCDACTDEIPYLEFARDDRTAAYCEHRGVLFFTAGRTRFVFNVDRVELALLGPKRLELGIRGVQMREANKAAGRN